MLKIQTNIRLLKPVTSRIVREGRRSEGVGEE